MGASSYTLVDATDKMSREIYGQMICQLGSEHEDIVGLSGDLAGSTKIIDFQKKFPERFFNIGIAEQNLYGTAAGLAKAGLTPYVSTFAAFTSMRACEQVRTDICYPNLNVKMVSTHGGTSVGAAGTTHHATEDIGILRTFANLTLIVPADGYEAANSVLASYDIKGPVYIRLNRGFDNPVHDSVNYPFQVGKAIEVHPGNALTLIACGTPVSHSLNAARRIQKETGASVRVLDMHTIKPIDTEAILKAGSETGHIITLEDHNTVGGLGDAVASVLAEHQAGCTFEKMGIPDEYVMVGKPEDIIAHYGMDQESLYTKILNLLRHSFKTPAKTPAKNPIGTPRQ